MDIIVLGLLTVLGIGIVVLAVKLRREKDPAKRPSPARVLVLSILAVALSVYQITREVDRHTPYVYDPRADQVLGRSLVDYFLPEDGNALEVVIIAYGADGDLFLSLSAQTRLDAFIETMRARGYRSPKVISPETVMRASYPELEDEYPMGAAMDMGIDEVVIRHAWETYPDADIVISMEGFPHRGLETLEQLKPVGSRLYILDLYHYWNWATQVENGFIDGVVAYRSDPDWSLDEGPDAAVFESRYIYLDTDNVAEYKKALIDTYHGALP